MKPAPFDYTVPGTLSEAFIAGLPPIIFGCIPGQEVGNVEYVQKHNAGAYAEEPEQIARLVQTWLDPQNNALSQMSANAARLARPNAALDIANEVCHLLEKKSAPALPPEKLRGLSLLEA